MRSDNESDEEIMVDRIQSQFVMLWVLWNQSRTVSPTHCQDHNLMFLTFSSWTASCHPQLPIVRDLHPTPNVSMLTTLPTSSSQPNDADGLPYIVSPVTPAIGTSSSLAPGALADSYDVADTPQTTSVQTTSDYRHKYEPSSVISKSRTHSKPHQCAYRHKYEPFSTISISQKHDKKSADDKMDKCSMCPKEYRLRSSLKRHMISHDIATVSCKVWQSWAVSMRSLWLCFCSPSYIV